MTSPSPTYEEIMTFAQSLANQNKEFVTYEKIGLSVKGRPIPLLTITDKLKDIKNKKVFLLTGGVDGDEEVGRAVNLGFANEILKPENKHYLESQVFLIVPCCNPDGTVDNLKDVMGNGSGIGAAKFYLPNQAPATPEAEAMLELVKKWIPDCCMDYHGLAGGGMGENMYLYPTVNDKWSRPLLFEVAKELSQACANGGFTIDGLPRLWTEPRYNLPGWLARNFSTFCMVLEGTENYYPLEDSVKAGVIRLMRLLAISNEKKFFQIYPNYPCDLISGGYMGSLFSYGSNYQERRESRREMSQMILEGVTHFGRKACDHHWEAVLELPLNEGVKTRPKGLTFRATIDKRAKINGVYWGDHKLEDKFYSIESFNMGNVVTANIHESPKIGINQLKIKYEVPFKRHVERSSIHKE